MATSLFEHRTYSCPNCYAGNLHPKLAYYCAWHEGHFISAPDFPSWVCDVCGQREYDPLAVSELEAILAMDRSRRQEQRRQQRVVSQAMQARKFTNSGKRR